jgi:hypothetical protein
VYQSTESPKFGEGQQQTNWIIAENRSKLIVKRYGYVRTVGIHMLVLDAILRGRHRGETKAGGVPVDPKILSLERSARSSDWLDSEPVPSNNDRLHWCKSHTCERNHGYPA